MLIKTIFHIIDLLRHWFLQTFKWTCQDNKYNILYKEGEDRKILSRRVRRFRTFIS